MTQPITGVIALDSLQDWAWEEFTNESMSDYDFIQPRDMEEDEDYVEIENCTYYIGLVLVDGLFEPDPDAEFSAVMQTLGGAYNLHVIASKTTTKVASMCSPCCPGQADIDSGQGNIECYALPKEYMGDE